MHTQWLSHANVLHNFSVNVSFDQSAVRRTHRGVKRTYTSLDFIRLPSTKTAVVAAHNKRIQTRIPRITHNTNAAKKRPLPRPEQFYDMILKNPRLAARFPHLAPS